MGPFYSKEEAKEKLISIGKKQTINFAWKYYLEHQRVCSKATLEGIEANTRINTIDAVEDIEVIWTEAALTNCSTKLCSDFSKDPNEWNSLPANTLVIYCCVFVFQYQCFSVELKKAKMINSEKTPF